MEKTSKNNTTNANKGQPQNAITSMAADAIKHISHMANNATKGISKKKKKEKLKILGNTTKAISTYAKEAVSNLYKEADLAEKSINNSANNCIWMINEETGANAMRIEVMEDAIKMGIPGLEKGHAYWVAKKKLMKDKGKEQE